MTKVNYFCSRIGSASVRFLAYSTCGIVVFFVPLELAGKKTIPLDHMVSFLIREFPHVSLVFVSLITIAGSVQPFVNRKWRNNKFETVLSMTRLLAIPLTAFYLWNTGPAVILAPDMIPFIFENVVIPVGLIVPVGAIFLSFLVSYGFLEFIGVLMEPIMRPAWRIPGRAAVDAVASFAGSYSIALLITNKVYEEGGYSAREAATIATGFSTVSATFMIVVAKTLNLIDHWNSFFWSTLLVTFLVSAITVRFRPLSSMDNEVTRIDSKRAYGLLPRLKLALGSGTDRARSAPLLTTSVGQNIRDGVQMSMNILPSILSISMIGLLLVKYTPVFEVLGYLFYPIIWLAQVPEGMVTAEAVATGIVDMYLPVLSVTETMFPTRFVVGVTSISSILFLSASIPCIMGTSIPISLRQLTVIWCQRTVLSVPLAAVAAYLLF